jgi:hypothetical protein
MDTTKYFSPFPQDFKNRYPERMNPLLPTYYQFSISRLPTVSYFCQSASLPTVTLTEVQMPTPFVYAKYPSKIEFDDLTIGFVVDEEMKNWLEIFNWMRSASTTEDFNEIKDPSTHLSNATLFILNSTKHPKMSVQFDGLYPKNLSSIDFSSTVLDPEPFVATCTFGYRSYSIKLF